MLSRLRRLVPPSGLRYELFDCSTFLLTFALVGYVLSAPASSSERALAGPLSFASDTTWGLVLAGAGVVGTVCSYAARDARDGVLCFGYVVMTVASGFWFLSFLVGFLTYDPSIRALLGVALYGFLTRRLISLGLGSIR